LFQIKGTDANMKKKKKRKEVEVTGVKNVKDLETGMVNIIHSLGCKVLQR
jgi:hypothetical protein